MMDDPISTIEELENQVSANPYAEEGYSAVVEHYQDLCDNSEDDARLHYQKLEEWRVQYALYCNPQLSFWMSWLTDCVIVANTESSSIQKVNASNYSL